MTHHRRRRSRPHRRRRAPGPHRPPDPADPDDRRRAAQDVRHPLGLLADGQHRHPRGARDRRGDPLRARQRADLRHLRHRDRLPDGGDPADDRDPLRHQRVEPAQRADDVHAGPAPRPGDLAPRRSSPSASASSRCCSRSRSARSATSSAPRSPAPTRSGTSARPSSRCIVLANVLGHARRLHARRADPQLRRRDRRRTSSTRSCCRRSRCCWQPSRTGSRTSSPGSTSTSPRATLFNGALTGEQWAQLAVTGVIWLVVPLAFGPGWCCGRRSSSRTDLHLVVLHLPRRGGARRRTTAR